MAVESGSQLGRYEIRSLIGAGGMGEVYLARDPKINRDVAIKVLPSAFSDDKERLDRFEQEAQAAGALNHPNILAIYDVDTSDGSPYVVSELLEGETLRSVLAGGVLPIRKATDYALQAAYGLAAAHEKGIIHRDLKPENLFITSDGRLKILDFGLAKLIQTGDHAASTDLPTRKINTGSGAVMGTAGYMSPEQLRGRQVDTRTDIFSFGAVLYEMLSGQKAFQRDSAADTISAILREDPPELSETNKNVNAGLERVVQRCLEKNREQRFHSASDLAFALESLTSTQMSGDATTFVSTSGQPVESSRGIQKYLGWAVAALLLASLVGLGSLYFRRAEPTTRTMRFTVLPPAKMNLAEASAISPDGMQIAFIVRDESGTTTLWVRDLASVASRQLAGTDGADFPFWSPDSNFLGFFAGGKLKKINIAGGPALALADASIDPRGGTWAADGTILFTPGTVTPVYKVPASGGSVTQVTAFADNSGITSQRWPMFLPDGHHFLYFGRGGNAETQGVYLGSLDSKDTTFLFKSEIEAIYAPTGTSSTKGQLLFVREGTLMAQAFDATSLVLSGEPVPLVQGVLNFAQEAGPTAYLACSASNEGTLVYRTGDPGITQLTWFDRNGKPGGVVWEPGYYGEPSFSPDGKKLLVGKSINGLQRDLYMFDLERGAATRLTFDPAPDDSSIFSPDGSRIVFSSSRGTNMKLYTKMANGSGNDELFYDAPGFAFADDWSKDGKYIIFEMDGGPQNKSDLWIMPIDGDRTPFPYLQTQFSETHSRFSPDGKWVAYSSDESGRAEIYVQSFPVSGGKWQISAGGGDQVQWRSDGKELFYIAPDRKLMAVTINAGANFEIGKPEPLFQTHLTISGIVDDRNNYIPTPDGQRFLVNELTESQNTQPMTVVLNWSSELKK